MYKNVERCIDNTRYQYNLLIRANPRLKFLTIFRKIHTNSAVCPLIYFILMYR